MSVPELIVEIAWTAGPYDVSPTWSDVSSYVRKVSVRRGRGSDFDDSFSSTASITFDNNARLFDPFNSSGANYANLKPRKQVRIRGLMSGTYYPIFRGYINGFPVTWSNSGFSSTVTVQAYDLLSLLATTNLKNDLADVFTRSLNPYHYYKCNDPNGSSTIKDYGSAGENLTIAGGFAGRQLASSYSLGIGLSGSSADLSNTFYTKYNSSVTPTSNLLTFAFWGAWPSGFNNEQTTGIDAVTSANSIAFYPNTPTAGIGFVETFNNDTASRQTSLNKVTSSAPSHYVFTYNGTTIKIFINGVDRTGSGFNGSGGSFFPTRSVWLWGGVFQDVAIFNAVLTDTQIADIYKFGAGSAIESTSARASRLMALTDVPAGLYSISGTSYGEILGVPADNANIRDALAQVMRTEAGYLFVTKAGILTTQHRNYFLTNSTSITSQATISDTGSGIIGYTGDVEIWYDGDNFRNDVAVDYGTGIQALASNGTSITNFGRHTYNVTTQSSTTAEAQEIADHFLAYYSLIVPSVSAIEVGLGATTNAEWTTILGLEVLDRVTFKRTPTTGSVFQQDLSLNNIEFDIVPKRWSVKLNGSARFAPSAPTVSVSSATSIAGTTATLNGLVSANYFSTTNIKFQYSTASNFASYTEVVASPSSTSDQGVSISAAITGLSHATTYYFRAVATNSIGTTTSTSTTLTTLVVAPTATIGSGTPTGTGTTATVAGTVSANGGSTTVEFQYGTDSGFATYSTITATGSPVSTQSASVSASLTGLTVGLTYYFRIRAVNSAGTTISSSGSFLAGLAPTITIASTTNFNQNSAVFNATVNPNGNTTSVKFQYSLNGSSFTDSGTVSGITGGSQAVTYSQSGLSAGTLYYVRAVATNAVGVSTSGNTTFTTYSLRTQTYTSGSGAWSNPVPTSGASGLAITTIYDALVVAGGGGAGDNEYFNGGGGGGVAASDSLTISGNLSYAVGGGGAASTGYTVAGGTGENSSLGSMSANGGGGGGTPNPYWSGTAGAGSGGTTYNSPFRAGSSGDLDGETGASTGGGGAGAGGAGGTGGTPWTATIYAGAGGAAVTHYGITVSSGAGGDANARGNGATEVDGATPASTYGGGGTGGSHSNARSAQSGLVRFYYYGP